MNDVFIKNIAFGTLRMLNIYEFYEVPRLFSVENEVGSTFVVYWIGENDVSDSWILIPISKLRLNRLENKYIDIRELLVNQEQKFFFEVSVHFDNESEAEWRSLSKSDIDTILLPKSGLYISEVTPAGLQASNSSEMLLATHEIRVSKTSEASNKNPKLDQVSRIFENFGTLYKSFLDSINVKSGGIEPISARPGSFILSFQASHLKEFEQAFRTLSDMMVRRLDVKGYMRENQIDIRSFTTLLASVLDTSTNFELKDNASDENILTIRKTDAAYYLPYLNKSAVQYITSYQVPQANDFDKLFSLVEMTWKGIEVNALNLKVDPRHVAYYKHAARVLGFFETNGSMTAVGQQLAESGDERRFKIAARCFESSYCGWAWIVWAGVENLRELDPKSAQLFLQENCPSLSPKTAIRRASTLTNWCEKLQDYYSEW